MCGSWTGFACTMGGWNPQLDELLAEHDDGHTAVRVLLLDNRGVGRSSIPHRRSAFTTTTMATDVLHIMVCCSCLDKEKLQATLRCPQSQYPLVPLWL